MNYLKLLAPAVAFLLVFSFAGAQEPPIDVPIEGLPSPEELIPVRETEYQEVQGSVEDSFYGIIYYDVYERAYQVDDFFPLGYRAVVNYDYYPRMFETSRGWEPRVQMETGSFYRGDKEIASYSKTFDVEGIETSSSRKGFSVMIPIMQVIAGVLGLDLDESNLP